MSTRVCALDELPVGLGVLAEVEGRRVALVRTPQDVVHAVDDTCTHANVSLSEGEVVMNDRGCFIECFLHGSLFDLSTGIPQTLPATIPLAVHTVTLRDGDVYVTLADEN